MNFLGWLQEIGVAGFLDMAIMALLLYGLLVWLKRTRRAAMILIGILIIGGFYLAARYLNLPLTAGVLERFMAVIAITLVVVFQEEFRYLFEQLAKWGLQSRGIDPQRKKKVTFSRREAEVLSRTLSGFANDREGALVVVRGKDLLIRHVEGGEELDGKISESILWSIFDPHSLGHDGAVIIERDRIQRLGCHLPLSKNLDKLERGGTRHAAALGLSELTDALCLVVSEERGTISAARWGEIKPVGGETQLAEILEAFYEEITPRKDFSFWQEMLRKNSREKLLALGIAVALWCVLVYPSQESPFVERTHPVRVGYFRLPPGLAVSSFDPPQVNVTFSGRRRAFLSLKPRELSLSLPLHEAAEGKLVRQIGPDDVTLPAELADKIEFQKADPAQVTVTIVPKPSANP